MKQDIVKIQIISQLMDWLVENEIKIGDKLTFEITIKGGKEGLEVETTLNN